VRGESLLQGRLDRADKVIGLDGNYDQSYRSDAKADTAERAPVWYVKLRLGECLGMVVNLASADITKCTINGRPAPQVKYDNPYSKIQIHQTATVHQHEMLRKKIEGALHDPPEFELIVTLPSKVKIEAAVCSHSLVAQVREISHLS
jgi:hypothetical protein